MIIDITGKKSAIVIGVSKYEKAEFPDLRFTTNDARRLARVLHEHCGFRKEHVHLFCDDDQSDSGFESRMPTYADILAQTQQIGESAGNEDLILFFFAGHGGEISKTSYLLTNDTRRNVIDQTALSVEVINRYIEESPAKCKLRLFDACRTAVGTRNVGLGRMTTGFQEVLLQTPKGSATLSSCSAGETALEHDELEQGLFSYYLCEGLSGQAGGSDGVVTIERLVDYIKLMMVDWCKLRTHTQTPQFVCNISGPFQIAYVPSSPAPAQEVAHDDALLAPLQRLYDRQIAETMEDVREARPTSADEARALEELVFGCLRQAVGEFSHPDLAVAIGDAKHLQNLVSPVLPAFRKTLSRSGLGREFQGEVVLQVAYRSTRTILPSHTLAVCVARFTFCYWIWWAVFFLEEAHLKNWRPKCPSLVDFCTVLPSASRDQEKIEDVVRAICGQMTETVEGWSSEVGAYLDERMRPLRESGDIIR